MGDLTEAHHKEQTKKLLSWTYFLFLDCFLKSGSSCVWITLSKHSVDVWLWSVNVTAVDMDTSFTVRPLVLALLLSLHLHVHLFVWAAMDSCYDEEGVPSSCMPKFENIAFSRTVVASNVCGSPPEDYCMQTGSTRSCHICDASDPYLSHNTSLLTDFHRNEEPTWWQSQSMYFRIQYPNSVNLTLHLGKSTHPEHLI